MAVTSEEATLLVDKARQAGLMLMMASKFRYVDEVIKAKDILESGILGEIILFENTFCSRVDMTGRWNSDPSQSGGGVLIDNGSHSVDIARYLLGPIDQIQAEEGKRAQGLEVEDDRGSPAEEMARRSGLAQRTFTRRFTAATGHSPSAYVQRLRIEEAKLPRAVLNPSAGSKAGS